MNLSYSDEQNMLREQVLKFCESDYTFDVREKIVESNYGHNPETWKQFADLGWLAVPFSEENGGFNFGPIELAVIFEEFGKALVAEPYLANVVMSGSVLESSSNELSKQTISNIIDGTTQVSVAFSEANNGYNFHDIETSVDDGKLNGVKTVVLNASFANSFLVYAKNRDKPVIYLVGAKEDGKDLLVTDAKGKTHEFKNPIDINDVQQAQSQLQALKKKLSVKALSTVLTLSQIVQDAVVAVGKQMQQQQGVAKVNGQFNNQQGKMGGRLPPVAQR